MIICCKDDNEDCWELFINGMKYTEMVETGKKPTIRGFDDVKKVCTSDDSGITRK